MIPSVDEIISLPQIKKHYENTTHHNIVECIRNVLEDSRREIIHLSDEQISQYHLSMEKILLKIDEKLIEKRTMSLRSVINATGVVLHTNLGRSPLSEEIKDALWAVASEYSTLEMDVNTGKRGSRYSHIESLICELTGAESALVVNNNAAAVTLMLSALAKDKEVIVSRGELVEIGGSFRIPEVMEQSGAALVEVGATNKTHLRDYEKAITENTGALLKVHTSNYRILGFTQLVSTEELVKLGKKYHLPSLEDVGSGVLVDLASYGLSHEPSVQSTIAAGIDVVTFSGDKLLGGPQAGIIAGKKEYIDQMKRHPLNRAFRIDKLTLAALEATLKIYQEEENVIKRIPILRMLTIDKDELYQKAQVLKEEIIRTVGKDFTVKVEQSFSQVGGGAMPLEQLPTYVVSLQSPKFTVNQLEEKLRRFKRPIFTRIHKENILLDVRTLLEGDNKNIIDALNLISNQ
ncbi:L-seryl-tRNA(Sec) selenium transferase [Irregularibacter muris]|uniref:L-seryl-tRNA(Sec) selenium transferase n=1 Tax=Irregularibacter muris TaxID=1796619 RepID=A0AAE3L053_9FIRM|nr:L-seryl-tRNA(Sec) selenium transferase [Irregularibacter muris]MCR1900240.1 L-seryl-tRNA(Sec) selenium transferase [Irregularibacter muris]